MDRGQAAESRRQTGDIGQVAWKGSRGQRAGSRVQRTGRQTGDIGQAAWTGDRGQRAGRECRGQAAEERHRAGGRRLVAEGWLQRAGCIGQATEGRQYRTGVGRYRTGDRESENRKLQEALQGR